MLLPVCPVQGLQLNFHCNLYAAFYVSPPYLLKLCCFLHFVTVTWISHCPVPKYHHRLSLETLLCSSFAGRLLANWFFSLHACKRQNFTVQYSSGLKKKVSRHFSDYHFTNKYVFLVLSFFLSGKGFVSKLDEFIHWLNEAMETTENWTPPKAETDSLKLYLETHLVGQDYTMITISN